VRVEVGNVSDVRPDVREVSPKRAIVRDERVGILMVGLTQRGF
jgi:hypothetical protein